MQITFLGVGESCDEKYTNTSVLITDKETQILLDCGFSVPHRYFLVSNDPNKPDGVWVSHFHGDHYFGLPLLILRLWDMKRTKPLTIIGQEGVDRVVRLALDAAYEGFEKKLSYKLEFKIVEPGNTLKFAGRSWKTAQTVHSQRNLGVLLDNDDKKIFYSGDGLPTKESIKLIRNCDLVIHESFRMNNEIPNHGSIKGCLEMAEQAKVKRMALVHLDRNFRNRQEEAIDKIISQHPNTFLPIDGMTFSI